MQLSPLALLIALLFSVSAAAQTPEGRLLICSKDASGVIIRGLLSLSLRTNPVCDQTKDLIPDGSRLVSDDFTYNLVGTLGTFQGVARLLAPDDRVLQTGTLRGTFGVNVRRDASKDCNFGHLEGIFEPVPTFAPATGPQITLAHFSADVIPEAAGPLPVYRARLDGLVAPAPVRSGNVSLNPDKFNYHITEPITALLTNDLAQTLQTYDGQSFCTVVQLQKQSGNQWTTTNICPLARPSLPVNIESGQTLKAVLLPYLQIPGGNAPGIYRLAAQVRALNPAGEFFRVLSAPFRVNALPSRGDVSVLLDREEYKVAEPILIKVYNDTARLVQGEDHRSDCSIVNVQRRENDKWLDVAPCMLRSATRPVNIEPRRSQVFTLPAPQFESKYEPGLYRVEFGYYLLDESGQRTGEQIKVYSQPFSIVARQ